MGRVIHSPVNQFPGDVVLFDPVPYPAYIEWERAVKSEGDHKNLEKQLHMFRGVRAMVETWSIAGFDIDNPAATPRVPVLQLLAWLVTEIGKVISGDTDPN